MGTPVQTKVDINATALPPAPAAQPPQQLPRRVPKAHDLIAPSAEVDVRGLPSPTLLAMVQNHMDAIHAQLMSAASSATARLKDPPPPPDEPLALRAMKF